MDNRNVRLTAVLAAVVAVLAVVALIVTTYLNSASSANLSAGVETPAAGPVDGEPAPAGPVQPSPTAEEELEGDDDHADYTPDPRSVSAIKDVTVRFLKAWATPGKAVARRALIAPYATPGLTEQLTLSDDQQVLPGKPATVPQVIAATAYSAATHTKWSDGQLLRCNLVLDTDGWKVTEVFPEEAPSPSATPVPTGTGAATATAPAPGGTRSPSPTAGAP
jgi:hypothetical protein